MRVAAFVLALTASVTWGIGGILIRKGTGVVTPVTILVLQYALGVALIAGWIAVRGESGSTVAAIGRHWPLLLGLVLLQIGGYVAFIVAIKYAGPGSLPTTTVVAIAATYPALIAVLSGPLLGERLSWNHALGAGLIVSGVVVTQAL
jgi:drug/metabolite transporter (DMT)-like permease